MAHYTVHFSCGHTEEIQLFGKHEDRERKIKYYEKCGQCSECYQRAKKEQEEAKKASALSVAGELPTLEGSEKQVAWANDIRAKWLAEFQEFCNTRKADPAAVVSRFHSLPEEEKAKQLNAGTSHPLAKMAHALTNQSAKFFIDNRF